MAAPLFIHLHVHTAFSLSAGAVHPEELLALAQQHSMPALAITDNNNLFGAPFFSSVLIEGGVQPLIGALVNLALPPNRGDSSADQDQGQPPIILLLVQTELGWQNLAKLISYSYLGMKTGEPPVVSLEQLAHYHQGLIALTGGGRGLINHHLLAGQRAAAERDLASLAEIFSGRLYIELQRGTDAEQRVEADLLDFADQMNLPIVATNSVYFAKPKGHESHEILLAIAAAATLSQDDRPRSSPQHYFKSPAEMADLFADLPEAIANTVTIARRCSFWLDKKDPALPPFPKTEFGNEAETLAHFARAGMEQKFANQILVSGSPDDYANRLENEISVINRMGYAGYFLIVADFINWARRNDIPVGPGRGSGVGSLVAFCMGITDLDPLRFGLIFERFLNPERVSMPDFDVDFCQDRRDEVIDYVTKTYGSDRVAQIITFGKLQARAVLRDVGRVMELPYSQVDQISKLVPQNPAEPIPLVKALEMEPQLKLLRDANPRNKELLRIGMELEGLYRHVSTHAAGIVIGERPLAEIVPLYCESAGAIPATQFNMKWVESTGLVKFDFLGLKTLSVIHRSLGLIAESEGKRIELQHIALDDEAVYQMLRRGETLGVFQLESSGMTDLAKRLKVADFDEIIAMISLFRPGPMENMPAYTKRRNKTEAWDCYHPSLEPILKTTYGIMIYQEQVMKMAQVMAGYSMAQADLLRRAMGKKDKAEMKKEEERFLRGAEERGYSQELARTVFTQMDKFAGYGFNKSHAAAYALISYHTAWLKYHYPVEFLAASMSYDLSNTDKLNQFKAEVERMGHRLLPPDINRSMVHFSVERLKDGTKAVRYGLAAIKNIGEMAMESVIQERTQNGEFSDIFNLTKRIDSRSLNKRQFEQLAAAGAFDSLAFDSQGSQQNGEAKPTRAHYYYAADFLMAEANIASTARQSGQSLMFDGKAAGGTGVALTPSLPALKAENHWSQSQELQHELAALGYYLTAHPLDGYRGRLKQLDVVSCNDLARRSGLVKIAGVILERKERMSKRGDRFSFAQVSDGLGSVEVTVFSEQLNQSRELLDSGRPLLFSVRVGEGRFTVESVDDLVQLVKSLKSKIYIEIESPEVAAPLYGLIGSLRISQDGAGESPAKVLLNFRDLEVKKEIEISLSGLYSLPPARIAAIKGLDGVVNLVES
ncbi:MAG: DNA polymerase III subunit alpha [Candidatus Pacebacteria bacterium]|nr:DNA polymerase III subunit alpha [Candidatus Paceibacterota bacterium]